MVRAKFAFTLIELLVVISIIALLVGILLPVLSSARVRGQQLISANNMRQIGLAIHMYQDEYDGWFPLTSHGNTSRLQVAWLYVLAPYLTDAELVQHPHTSQMIWEIGPVRVCPRDPQADERMANSATSYMLNEWVAVPFYGPSGIDWSQSYNRRDMLVKPSDTYVMFVNANDTAAHITADHAHSRSWTSWPVVVNDISTDRYGANGSPPDFLNGSSNYLFGDNHVEEIPAPELKALIDAGVNFSRPPE